MGVAQGVEVRYSTETVLELGTNYTQKYNRGHRGRSCIFASVAKFDTRQVATAIVESQGVEEKGRQTDFRAPSSCLHIAGVRTPCYADRLGDPSLGKHKTKAPCPDCYK